MVNTGLTGNNSSNTSEQMSRHIEKKITTKCTQYEIRYSRHKFLMDSKIFLCFGLAFVSLGSCFSHIHSYFAISFDLPPKLTHLRKKTFLFFFKVKTRNFPTNKNDEGKQNDDDTQNKSRKKTRCR